MLPFSKDLASLRTTSETHDRTNTGLRSSFPVHSPSRAYNASLSLPIARLFCTKTRSGAAFTRILAVRFFRQCCISVVRVSAFIIGWLVHYARPGKKKLFFGVYPPVANGVILRCCDVWLHLGAGKSNPFHQWSAIHVLADVYLIN